MKNIIKNKKGITLIALIITIIVLLILAGVSITFLSGENGIVSKAQRASKEYKDAASSEEQSLNGVDANFAKFLGTNLPENTAQTEAGTIVKLPDLWATETMRYLAVDTGLEVASSTKVATVYAVAVGGGTTIPVPYGFYYVGGNLNSGVVISDNEQDKNKYVGQADVPSGFSVSDSLQPVYDLQGNQFVWIPCTVDSYKKTSYGVSYQNTYYDETTYTGELDQISKYGGFYVGRFESGLAKTINSYTATQQNFQYNQVYNLAGVPESKPGKDPWNFIDWTNSQKNSRSMYVNNYVVSGLITGTQWDVMINKIASVDNSKTVTTTWGNVKTQSLTYNGKLATATVSTYWDLTPFGSFVKNGTKATTTGNAGWLLTTGASEQAKAYNIYDVAGNLWEWTEESSYYGGNTSTQYRVARGNSFVETNPDCYRAGTVTTAYTSFHVGYRVVLYMK